VNTESELTISTPGRVCLFGEHQDYLLLPVISCAISLRIFLDGKKRKDNNVRINLPDINSSESFVLNGRLHYERERDYFKSVVNVMIKHGFTFSNGFNCNVNGNIPINSGTSSSSALIVTWVNFLSRMSDQAKILSDKTIARYAHEAEILEFNEPGGMMDQYSTALGGVIYMNFHPHISIEKFPANLKTFVLGDSGEPKDTKLILARVKNQIVDVVKKLKETYKEFSLQTVTLETIELFSPELTGEQVDLLKGTIINRDITTEARTELLKKVIDDECLGKLLNRHQDILRDTLQISTPKIDRMINAALNAGAAGAKINGSGGGGCMFAYAPNNPEAVAEAIEKAGGKAFIVYPDCGTKVEKMETNS